MVLYFKVIESDFTVTIPRGSIFMSYPEGDCCYAINGTSCVEIQMEAAEKMFGKFLRIEYNEDIVNQQPESN